MLGESAEGSRRSRPCVHRAFRQSGTARPRGTTHPRPRGRTYRRVGTTRLGPAAPRGRGLLLHGRLAEQRRADTPHRHPSTPTPTIPPAASSPARDPPSPRATRASGPVLADASHDTHPSDPCLTATDSIRPGQLIAARRCARATWRSLCGRPSTCRRVPARLLRWRHDAPRVQRGAQPRRCCSPYGARDGTSVRARVGMRCCCARPVRLCSPSRVHTWTKARVTRTSTLTLLCDRHNNRNSPPLRSWAQQQQCATHELQQQE